jgi:hypothetical protein
MAKYDSERMMSGACTMTGAVEVACKMTEAIEYMGTAKVRMPADAWQRWSDARQRWSDARQRWQY